LWVVVVVANQDLPLAASAVPPLIEFQTVDTK